MTAQFTENLTYEGQVYAMCTEPLGTYFQLTGVFPDFSKDCTALWRGYIGTWEVRLDRLYLLKLDGHLASGEDISLATLFPEFPERVFAHWYTGSVRLPQGRRIEYVHMGYQSRHEADLFLDFERGHLVARRLVTNEQCKRGDPFAPNVNRAWD